MADLQVRSLRVLPVNAAELSFAVAGIVSESNVTLGQRVSKFDFPALNSKLGATVANPTPDPSTLQYNSQAIHDDPSVSAARLLALRAESIRASLDKAIAARTNVYWQKYFNPVAVAGQMVTNNNAKTSWLNKLYNTLQTQATMVGGSYGSAAVVKGTTVLNAGGLPLNSTVNVANRVPYLENNAQLYRGNISLDDEILTAWMNAQTMPKLNVTLANELAGIDLGIRQLQVAYLSTILLPPISGNVTMIRKQPGDYVKAGETVVRVEDNSSVYLVGTLLNPPVITPMSSLTFTIYIPGQSPLTIKGKVVHVTGGVNDNSEWHIVALCSNPSSPAAGTALLPLHYSLDPQTTIVRN
jgi:hypothetical protein